MVKIIAEVGSVHDGSFGNALKLIDLCKEVGADVAKFQTHIAKYETTRDAPSPKYFNTETRFNYFERTGFSQEQWYKLKEHCADIGIEFLSSPFSVEAAKILTEIGQTTFKIASGEINNFPLLDFLNKSVNSVYVSSGMSPETEITLALDRLNECQKIVLFQCTSEYPCPPENVGLAQIPKLLKKYNFEVGLSDHYSHLAASIAAVALGATYIEKHITFSKYMYGSDAKNSMEPDEFTKFVHEVRDAYEMVNGPPVERSSKYYDEMRTIFQKSIYWRHNKKAGDITTNADFLFLKPSIGIPASKYMEYEGKILKKDVTNGDVVEEGCFK